MHYELQTLIFCPQNSEQACGHTLEDAAKDLEKKLRAAGIGFVIEVRDIGRGKRLFRSVEPGPIGKEGL